MLYELFFGFEGIIFSKYSILLLLFKTLFFYSGVVIGFISLSYANVGGAFELSCLIEPPTNLECYYLYAVGALFLASKDLL